MEYIDMRVRKDLFEAQVRSVCSDNLRNSAKICRRCVLLGYVLQVMDECGLKYSRKYRRYVKSGTDEPEISCVGDFPEPP